jgi:hypothetical protein
MATALPILDIQEPGPDLARKTVFIKLHPELAIGQLRRTGRLRETSARMFQMARDKAVQAMSEACAEV